MALNLFARFAPRINPVTPEYPVGSIKNETIPGSSADGTPLDADWGNDYAGFDGALLAAAGLTASGTPDTALVSQRLAAFRVIFVGESNFESVAGKPTYKYGGLSGALADAAQGDVVLVQSGESVGNFVSGKVELRGVGSSSIIKSNNANPSYIFERHGVGGLNDWDFYRVSSITFDGNSKSAHAITFSDDPFSGRWSFDNVNFQNANYGVYKETGNIGDSYRNASYGVCNYGYRALSNPSMHTGASVHYTSHWEVCDIACYYINDSLDGCGQWVIRDSIMEQCGGFGVFMDLHNNTPFTPPVFDNLWMEAIATTPSVLVDGVPMAPRQYYFKDTPFARIRDSYLYNVELINSRVHADGVRIDDAYISATPTFEIGVSSKLTVDNLYASGIVSGKPFVNSIINQQSDSLVKQLSVRGPLMHTKIPIANVGNCTDICSNSFSGVGPWGFVGTVSRNANSVADGVLNATCAELLINNGETLLGPQVNTPTGNTFAVWSIHAKLVSGNTNGFVGIVGGDSTLGSIYTRNVGEWVRSYGIQSIPVGASTVRLQFINASGTNVTLRFADLHCVTFATAEEAYDFVNSGFSIQNVV